MQPMLLPLRSPLIPRLLVVFILCFTSVYAKADTGAQNDHPVTLSGNTTLRSVFKAIKQQTGFAVMYSSAATALNQDEKVTVNFKDTPLDDVLAFVLRGKDLDWKYSDDVLVIHKKEIVREKKIEADSTVTPATLTGKVTDVNGMPLIGATVQVKGTNQGTTTDQEGNFTLPKVSNGSTLIISTVGYERREISVKGRSVLTQLSLDISKLDETVIIAYGTTTKRLSTSNISTVKAKDIEMQPVNNPLLALQGRVPGLVVTQANGVPGGAVTVRIQGQNSIGNGNDPLYIIDGVPYFPQNLTTFQGATILGASRTTGIVGNPLSFINPADIESIDILKDADATAIYGSRAANGAILITTKKGKVGQTKLDINVQQGWSKVGHFIDLMNTEQYMLMRKEAKKNDNAAISASDYDLNGLWDTTRYTDWQKTLIGGTAQYAQYSATISGGTEIMQYLVGGTYHRETTVYPGNFSDKRGSVHFNINSASANQRFHLQFSGSYMTDKSNLPGADLTQNIFLAPVAPALYNTDGTLNWEPDPNANGRSSWTNPLSKIYNLFESNANSLVSDAVLSYRILQNLELKSSLGYTSLLSNQFSAPLINTSAPENRPNFYRYATFSFNTAKSWIIEPQISYYQTLGKGKIDFLLGSTIQQQNNEGTGILAAGQPNDQLLKSLDAATAIYPNGTDVSTYKYNAIFWRLNYNWQDKYIINLVMRRDGSSRFGSKNKFQNFASVGAAWIFSQEPFSQKNLSFLSFGKLRASYGSTGSDQIGNYQYLNLYYPYFTGVTYGGGPSLVTFGLSNPYLKWEETRKLQLGIDLGTLSDRILLSTTYVRNRTSNQLLSYNLPNITGFNSVSSNFPAMVQNTAWELVLSTENIRNTNFKWSSNLNVTIPRNKLLAFPNLETSAYKDQLTVGRPLQEGMNSKTYRFYGVDPTTGIYQVYDKDGKPTSTPVLTEDATVFINSNPKFYGGLQNTLSYKGVQLDFFFAFTIQKNFNFLGGSANGVAGTFRSGEGNQPVSQLARWQKPGDITNIQRFTTRAIYGGPFGDQAIQDVSFLRFQNFSISYQPTGRFVKKCHFQSCKIFINAQNICTFTRYKGLDPGSFNSRTLPPLRTATAGVQLGL